MKLLSPIYFILSCTLITKAQDSTAPSKRFTLDGYIKNLETLSFDKNFKELTSLNLIHNRINLKWKPSENIRAVAELRNRLFWGEEVKLNPDFALLLRNENEKGNLQKAWINNNALILHSNVERLYLDYQTEQWNVRFGRQRINWGVTTTWNPNDIFNTYNFLDFDYEERPGIDGGKLKYIFNNNSNVEFAYANTGKPDGDVTALKYSLNKWNYDMQFIAGRYKQNLTLGAGWAGYINSAGFKGEVQYFFQPGDSAGRLHFTLEGDYMFKKEWYVKLGMLYNRNGMYKPPDSWHSLNLKVSPENLMPTKWNFIITSSKEFTPLMVLNMSVLYAPGTNLLIVLPALQYNMATNLDLSLVWQFFFAELNNRFEALNHRCFFRTKWNF